MDAIDQSKVKSKFTFFSALSSFLSRSVSVFFSLAFPLLDLEGFFLGGSGGVLYVLHTLYVIIIIIG
jgi:hypothetical protein